MSTWSLGHIAVRATLLDDATYYGHNVFVTFKLDYQRSAGDSAFAEMPPLVWREKFIMKTTTRQPDGTEARAWWVHEADMYHDNPHSLTLKMWPMRYAEAYRSYMGIDHGQKGSAQLLNRRGEPKQRSLRDRFRFTPRIGESRTPDQQATAVRSYLSTYGHGMKIELHDIPALLKRGITPEVRKERLLLITAGVQGGTQWVTVRQHLIADMADPRPWQESCTTSSVGGAMPAWAQDHLDVVGFTRVAPPAELTLPRNREFLQGAGEYP